MIRPAFPLPSEDQGPDVASIQRFERMARSITNSFQPHTVDGASHVAKGFLLTGDTYVPQVTLSFDRQMHLLTCTVELGAVRNVSAVQLVTILRIQANSKLSRIDYDPEDGQLSIRASALVVAEKDSRTVLSAVIEDLQGVLSDDRLRSITGK